MTNESDNAQLSSRFPATFATFRSSVSGFSQSNVDDAEELAAAAQKILEDPVALQRLSDRILTLLAQDLRLQRERTQTYGRR